MKLTFKTPVEGNFKSIASQFNVDLFKKLALPGTEVFIRSFEGTKKGDELSFTMKALGFHQYWEGLIVDNGEDETKSFFVDVGKNMPFPLKSWSHRHSFEKISENKTMVIDEVDYSCDYRVLDYAMFPFWQFYFNYRSYLYKKIFG